MKKKQKKWRSLKWLKPQRAYIYIYIYIWINLTNSLNYAVGHRKLNMEKNSGYLFGMCYIPDGQLFARVKKVKQKEKKYAKK